MPFHNPFIKDGLITFPEGASLVKHVERWAKVRGDRLAYRFLDFSTERDGVARDLHWADFSARNRAVGARLQQVTQPGDRVAILCPQNLEYLVAFFGTLYSGRIAVPLFDPSEPGHVGRLHAVLDDCSPAAILTTTDSAEGVRKFFRTRPAKERPRVIAVDAIPDEVGATWEHSTPSTRDTIAYLQYTSGSTRIPSGVQITHIEPGHQRRAGDRGPRRRGRRPRRVLVAVLPRHGPDHRTAVADDRPLLHVHDTGRIRSPTRSAGCARSPGSRETPAAPSRWHPTSPSTTPRPAVCPRTARSRWTCPTSRPILNGSEPISAATVQRFNEAFGPFGFQPKAIKPSYGLAEATLFVSTTPSSEEPTIISVDRDELNAGRFVPVPDDSPTAVAQAGAGKIGVGRVGGDRRPRHRHRACRRSDRRDLDQRPEHGHGLLEQAGGDGRDVPEHPEVADQSVARPGRERRCDLGAHRRSRRLPRRRALHHRPHQGSGHHRRPQPLPPGSGVLRPGVHQGGADRVRGRVLGPGQPVARRGVRQRARRSEAGCRATPPSSW